MDRIKSSVHGGHFSIKSVECSQNDGLLQTECLLINKVKIERSTVSVSDRIRPFESIERLCAPFLITLY